jgi:hypothetical protein|tara:strand:+ start:1546 stop:1683 length:138 start_codon:yes stop_codon:yes gene_type:complete
MLSGYIDNIIEIGIYALSISTSPIKIPYFQPNNKTPLDAPAFLLP